MKNDLHNPLHLVTYHCISCQTDYQMLSSFQGEVKKIEVCKNCHPFWTKIDVSQVKVGKVELFYQRQKRAEEIESKKPNSSKDSNN